MLRKVLQHSTIFHQKLNVASHERYIHNAIYELLAKMK